jgi:alcohol dehydrogenase
MHGISTFKIANKLITGNGATAKLKEEAEALGIKNPLIVTDEILMCQGLPV